MEKIKVLTYSELAAESRYGVTVHSHSLATAKYRAVSPNALAGAAQHSNFMLTGKVKAI
jgi:hypothetical protein